MGEQQPHQQLEIGSQIAGRYEIEALIGTGGFADVYRARHLELGSYHALKVLTWRRKGLAERFLNEGRVQATLGHPNVVTVTDVLRFDGHVALVMEYIDGTNLEELLTERGALPLNEAMALFVPVLAAVAAAHDRKIWHRDLKPANVLLARTPVGWVPKVADFGIAKIVEEMGEGQTSSGIAMGSPGYMAPEQVRDSSSVDQRTDIFALGAILYEMLTGRRAFADETGVLTLTSTIERVPPPITDPQIPPAIVAAITRAMDRDREQRFQSCRALAGALGIGGHPLLLDAEGRAMFASLDGDPSSLYSSSSHPPQSVDRRNTTPIPSTTGVTSGGWLLVPFAAGTLAMVAAALLLVLGALMFGVLRSQMSEPETAEVMPVIKPEPATLSVLPPEAPSPVPEVPSPVPLEEPQPPAPQPPAPPPPGDPSRVAPVSVEPEPAPAPEVAPEPVPEPEPAVAEIEPEPEPAVAPAAPVPRVDPNAMVGLWKGKGGSKGEKNFELRIDSASKGVLRAELVFFVGTTSSIVQLSGTVDAVTGRFDLQSSGSPLTVMSGLFQDGQLAGSYKQGKGDLLKFTATMK